jgi:hypothetical protein
MLSQIASTKTTVAVMTTFQTAAALISKIKADMKSSQTAARMTTQLGTVLIQSNWIKPANPMITPTIMIFVSDHPVIDIHKGEARSHTPAIMAITLASLD